MRGKPQLRRLRPQRPHDVPMLRRRLRQDAEQAGVVRDAEETVVKVADADEDEKQREKPNGDDAVAVGVVATKMLPDDKPPLSLASCRPLRPPLRLPLLLLLLLLMTLLLMTLLLLLLLLPLLQLLLSRQNDVQETCCLCCPRSR